MALCQKCGRLRVSAKYPSATGTGPAVMSASSRRSSGSARVLLAQERRGQGGAEHVPLGDVEHFAGGSPSRAAMTAAQANVPAWNDALYPGPFSGAREASPFTLAHPLVA